MTLFGPILRVLMRSFTRRIHAPDAIGVATGVPRCKLYIRREALQTYVLMARKYRNEVGFLCLGTRARYGRKLVLEVVHIDLVAEGSRAYVELPAREKARVIAARPELAVLGWAHTHPGFGVFWSGTDRENCRDFGENGVNLVFDPLSGELGVALGTRFVFRGPARQLARGGA
jgi:proteasome lid subunit RPN8/RPN11